MRNIGKTLKVLEKLKEMSGDSEIAKETEKDGFTFIEFKNGFKCVLVNKGNTNYYEKLRGAILDFNKPSSDVLNPISNAI